MFKDLVFRLKIVDNVCFIRGCKYRIESINEFSVVIDICLECNEGFYFFFVDIFYEWLEMVLFWRDLLL